ncbi:MAG: hypothetical protein GF320_21280 [Armatimonadia bacterium]|nr:hypothetical protein [Armatimonadia bacterium]
MDLHSACRRGDVARVRELLESGAPTEAPGWGMQPPLVVAAMYGQVDVVRLLLDHGADPNVRTQDGMPVLHLAGSSDLSDMAALLLDHGADLGATDGEDRTALDWALLNGSPGVARLLLDRGILEGASSEAWARALENAAQSTRPAGVDLLIERGARVEDASWNPLQAAIVADDAEAAKRALAEGVAIDEPKEDPPLVMAARLSRGDLVRILTQAGADTSLRNRYEQSALELSAHAGHSEVVELLLEAGADPNGAPEPRDPDSCYWVTPLGHAAAAGDLRAMQALLRAGAEVGRTGGNRQTAMHSAALYSRPDAVRLLAEHGADPNARDSHDCTPLHGVHPSVPNAGDSHATIRALVDAGTDINAHSGMTRMTPLLEAAMTATTMGDYAIVALLLELGADPNTDMTEGMGALSMAVHRGDAHLTAMLLQAGADPNSHAPGHPTLLERAERMGRADLADLLRRYGAEG